jgi:hypothetical protein
MEDAMQGDKIPAEIMREARDVVCSRLTDFDKAKIGYDSVASVVQAVAFRLLARDTAARKECAEIARQKYIARVDDDGKMAFAAGSEIATAIEATITGGGDAE